MVATRAATGPATVWGGRGNLTRMKVGLFVLHDRRWTLARGHSAIMASLAPTGPSAPQVGAELATARERAGRTLAEMARALRIRIAFLEALEDGRILDLPSRAYALGFLRSYATALGLDADEAVRRFKAEAAELDRPAALAFPAPLPERGLPTGALMLIALVLVVAAYAGWYRLSGEGRLPAEAVQPVPAKLAQLVAPKPPKASVGQRQALAASPQTLASAAPPIAVGTGAAGVGSAGVGLAGVGSAGAVPGQSASAADVAVATAASPAGAPGAPQSGSPTASLASPVGASPVGAAPVATGAAPPPGSAAAAVPTAAQDAAMKAATPGLVVLATADAWIQVRDATGAVVFSHLLHAGDSWPVPAGQVLALTTGNAGGTELVNNGVASSPLGLAGAVLRNVALPPAAQ